MKFYYLCSILTLVGCTKTEYKNDRLLGFQSTYLGERTSSQQTLKLIKGLEEDIKVTYIDDLIIASKILEVNECGKYEGDLDIRQDTIVLIQKQVSRELCDSQVIERFSYIISNPELKKYKIYLRSK